MLEKRGFVRRFSIENTRMYGRRKGLSKKKRVFPVGLTVFISNWAIINVEWVLRESSFEMISWGTKKEVFWDNFTQTILSNSYFIIVIIVMSLLSMSTIFVRICLDCLRINCINSETSMFMFADISVDIIPSCIARRNCIAWFV